MDKNLVEAYEVACEKKDIDNFVSFTAVTVSASRLADGMREIPLYRDPLLADMLGSSKGTAPEILPSHVGLLNP